MEGEERSLKQRNSLDQTEIDELVARIEKLEAGKNELSAFLETQVIFLKELELKRIDLGLYIQTRQAHSGGWYRSAGAELSAQKRSVEARRRRRIEESRALDHGTGMGGAPPVGLLTAAAGGVTTARGAG